MMLDRLHAGTFSAQMHTTFSIHVPGMQVVAMELVEVTEGGSAGGHRPAGPDLQGRFSIIFRGPRGKLLQQGMYQMQHNQLGAFDLFLVPVGRDHDGVYYEVVFNRLRRLDA
jgi:hypothetical protein